ncbi:bifunctional riboflavin kinase/FAD synthetase [Aristaeella hokkaidonensis]|uniref:Bifunctional riboflavin kinase/FAD synthetase n=1 Tax=Aristaeella hokkaidonensis TaxID=3046382 RepID=A0AC61N8F2_9FIRM|nr:bifunctional riboflavin kinase/FAD synthetase [Aristaeella hokkaidonensis]QUC67834.1 bifunctional riboflavin kinase/FAD synthetase [Aristaeella hokkaidonensis]SNT92898.1 FMN adenylyltransferase /riboflavin kinase [Aristaeella hokkaidonensis]
MHVLQRPHKAGERVVALGMFDGVHRGHRTLLLNAKRLADEIGVPLRVCTFNRHPLEIIRPENPPEMISTIPERASLLYGIGVDEMELIPFDQSTANMEPEVFLDRMRSFLDVRAVVAGWNYSFGRKGRGTAELLKADGEKHGYKVIIEPPATLEDGTVISSTLIRQNLKEGKTERAAELLGYQYSLTGTVAEGKHQGHGLGFPTANIEPWKRKVLPKYGVYTGLLETTNDTLPAVVNIGIQPTMPSGKVTVEAHALTESPELYGQKVRLTLLKMLREERKFASPQDLTAQIERDRNEAMQLFNMA